VFFERFRAAAARLPDGLIRPMPPAPASALARAEAALGAPLPAEYASFLRSFDGADLFHGAVVIAGVGASAPRDLLALAGEAGAPPGSLAFAEAQASERFVLDATGRVWRLSAGSDERSLAGSGFERWLDATIAREQILYGPDGEFADDAFDEDGEEVRPRVALRQAERALRADPGSAEAEHARGIALGRLGRHAPALEAFAAATALDPENPWPWFDLGRTALEETGDPGRAAEAFRRAAALEPGPGGARLHVWAARAARAAGDEAGAAASRRAALAIEPTLEDGLRRARAQAEAEGDDRARGEAEALMAAMSPEPAPARVRLPVIVEEPPPGVRAGAAPPRPRDRPRRPRRAGPRRGGASRRESKRPGR
jgi:tetratricopeptide (TPR) repeat protein